MITEITYRRAQVEDLRALVGLELACFTTPWSEASLLEDLEDQEHKFYYVAETTSGGIVGYIGCALVLDEGQVTNVAVYPTWQGEGIGRGLVKTLKNAMEDKGARIIYLEVRQSNEAAIGLYQAEGFTIDGSRKDFYTHPKEDAFLMSYVRKEQA